MRGSLIARASVALGAFVVTLGLTQATPVQLAFWNFNDNDAIVDGGVNGGTLSFIGGVTKPTGTFAGSPPANLDEALGAFEKVGKELGLLGRWM